VTTSTARIQDIESLVDGLSPADRSVFHRIYWTATSVGQLDPPAPMNAWIEDHFGSVDAVRSQQTVRVTNTVTWEGALFNPLRARRPMQVRTGEGRLSSLVDETGDDFCRPLQSTPADLFGRVESEHAVTASNLAKGDALHAVIVFRRHNPLVFGEPEVVDYIDTALRWGQLAHAQQPAARYFFFVWNCLWKAGMHYPKIEGLRRVALAYGQQYATNYFDDVIRVHRALGLAFRWRNVTVAVHLTPIKERETLLIAEALTDDLMRAVYRVLKSYRDASGVSSFNVALYMRPIAEVAEDWQHFPVMFRVVDRGDPRSYTTDVGGMELYAASVIGSDPFSVVRDLRAAFADRSARS
jgi:hypothetical protein